MLTITVTKVASSQITVDVEVTVTSSTALPGIQNIGLYSLTGALLDLHQATNCPASQSYTVKAITYASLPLYVTVLECQVGVDQGQTEGVATSRGPFLGEEVGIVPCQAAGGNIPKPACIQLQVQIQTLRNNILSECPQLANLVSQRTTALVVALTTAAIAFGLAEAAGVAPWPLNLVLGIAAAVAATVASAAAIAWYVLKGQVDALTQQMAQQRAALTVLVGRLGDVCCPEFITVEQDVPLCP